MNHNRNDMEPELKGDRLVEAGNWVALVSPSEGLKKRSRALLRRSCGGISAQVSLGMSANWHPFEGGFFLAW